MRHDMVVQGTARILRAVGMVVNVEPKCGGKKPDTIVISSKSPIYADVSIGHPLAPSHLTRAQEKPLVVAENREKKKNAKYQEDTEGGSMQKFMMVKVGMEQPNCLNPKSSCAINLGVL